ncbi:hypothetical protein EDE12_106166 [Methylosinus sp. sav-2]|uniref:hypothetical protein n=1 Tax=Methylosinus sp. sav-2 TaxID=2485168 RepID=UPI0010646CD7|nr:hypothetical protein [Methylosinus sp. sav-2]TDX64020.1 hypothetical protein EDE12_106166 [Methylosinus sp. sav-2]
MSDPLQAALDALELNEDGSVKTRPVLGWTITPVAGMSVLLRILYAETPAELKTGGQNLQVILTPAQALDLAQSLAKPAMHILSASEGPGKGS